MTGDLKREWNYAMARSPPPPEINCAISQSQLASSDGLRKTLKLWFCGSSFCSSPATFRRVSPSVLIPCRLWAWSGAEKAHRFLLSVENLVSSFPLLLPKQASILVHEQKGQTFCSGLECCVFMMTNRLFWALGCYRTEKIRESTKGPRTCCIAQFWCIHSFVLLFILSFLHRGSDPATFLAQYHSTPHLTMAFIPGGFCLYMLHYLQHGLWWGWGCFLFPLEKLAGSNSISAKTINKDRNII